MFSIKPYRQLSGHNASIFALARAKEPDTFYSADGNGWVVKWDLRQEDFGQAIAQVPLMFFHFVTYLLYNYWLWAVCRGFCILLTLTKTKS